MPGLLAHKLGHLHSFAQSERSSVAQAYVTLFAIVLDHAVLTLRCGDETTVPVKVRPPARFVSHSSPAFGTLFIPTPRKPLSLNPTFSHNRPRTRIR
jgi:hypothetical protein